MITLHHTHLMATDIDSTIAFWHDAFGAEVAGDLTFAGARNVFMRVGSGRLHLYDQPPRQVGQGTVHHLGVQTDDLDGLVAHLREMGVSVTDVRRDPAGAYAMAEAPDGLLVELFEPDRDAVPEELREFFGLAD